MEKNVGSRQSCDATLLIAVLLSTMLPHWFSDIHYKHAHIPIPIPSMRQTFDLIQDYCGEVCDTTISPSGRGKYFDVVEKDIDCDRLFSDDFIEGWAPSIDEAPPDLESLVLACFSYSCFCSTP